MSTAIDFGHEPDQPPEERDPTPEEMAPVEEVLLQRLEALRRMINNSGMLPATRTSSNRTLAALEDYLRERIAYENRDLGHDPDEDCLDPFAEEA